MERVGHRSIGQLVHHDCWCRFCRFIISSDTIVSYIRDNLQKRDILQFVRSVRYLVQY